MFELIIPIITVIISVTVSIIMTSVKTKIEIQQFKTDLEQKYIKALFDKRIEVYPALYETLSDYAKKIYYKEHNLETLRDFQNAIDIWNSKNSLFFTIETSRFSHRFRQYLNILLKQENAAEVVEKEGETLRDLIEFFEGFIKAEIGIFATPSVGKSYAYQESYDFIQRQIDKLTR